MADYRISTSIPGMLAVTNDAGVALDLRDSRLPTNLIGAAGGNGNDLLVATNRGSFLWGGIDGGDTLIGGTGNDYFLWGAGFGNDVIYNSDQLDSLWYVNLTSTEDLLFTQQGNDLQVMIYGDSQDSLLIKDWYSGNTATALSQQFFATPSLQPRTNWALIVGITDYSNSDQLPGAAYDARTCEQFTKASHDWGRSHDTVLMDSSATQGNVLSALGNLAGQVQTGDNLLFTYSGHGAAGSGNLALYDYDASGGVSPQQLYAALQPVAQRIGPTGHITITADSCYSGLFTQYFTEVQAGNQFTVLAAARSDQLSVGRDTGGVFTNAFWRDGVLGAAADTGQTGIVTARDAYQYTLNKLAGSETQVAQIYDPSPNSWVLNNYNWRLNL